MARRTFTELAVSEHANAILDIQPAMSATLSTSLVSLRQEIEAAAQANVEMAIQGGDYTETEIEALVTVESLKQVGGLELTAVLLRAMYLRAIMTGNMIANHPGGYNNLNAMAADNGISVTELSQTLDLVNVIFPYVQENLGISVPQLWEQLGKAKLKELVPVLKAIITGEASDTRTVRAGVEAILNDAAATLANTEDGERFQVLNDLAIAETETARAQIRVANDLTPQNVEELQTEFNTTIRGMAVARLIEDGAMMTVRALRNTIRPEHTDNIHASVVPLSDGRRLVTAIVDPDQFVMLDRKMGTSLERQEIDLPDDPRQRQAEAARIIELRELLRLLGI